jgi:hypothetical protein
MDIKKTTKGSFICVGCMLGCAALMYGQVRAAGVNYQQVAMLKWYGAASSGNSVPVGNILDPPA